MTCIVGIESDNGVFIAGDSAGTDGWGNQYILDVDKVFANANNPDYIIGYTTSFRMGQLLRYKLNPPECPDWDVERFMVTDFVDEVKRVFKEDGFGKDDSGGTFLVGYRGRLFKIESDFQVSFHKKNEDNLKVRRFDSCGSGQSIAIGALAVLADSVLPEEEILTRSLNIASQFNAGVVGPFTHVRSLT